ncbi:hypothetical protein ACRXCV_00530 (plasmid) [Halobacteriovorax sp. GFR7]|uniref:hypothetical protein n=1 Tax=unclassified Halobacteriovorax TaxID=2639665 RepID=UPI003D95CFF6
MKKANKDTVGFSTMDAYQAKVDSQVPDRSLYQPVQGTWRDWVFGLDRGLRNTYTSIMGAPMRWLFSGQLLELACQQVRTCTFISAAKESRKLDFSAEYCRDLDTPEASHFNEMMYYRKTLSGEDTELDGECTVYVPVRIFDLMNNLNQYNQTLTDGSRKLVYPIQSQYHEDLIKSCDDMSDLQYSWDDEVVDFYHALGSYFDVMCENDGVTKYSVEMWSMAACLCVFAPHPDYEQDQTQLEGMFSTEPVLIIPFEQFYGGDGKRKGAVLGEAYEKAKAERANYEKYFKENNEC